MAFKPNTGQSTTYTTTYYYDANGHLTFAYVADGRPRSITYVNDANGQVLVRSEVDNKTTGDPKQVWWYFDGKQVGTTGNNGNDDPDYATALTERLQPPASAQGPFRLGSTYGTTFSDFDQAYNSLSPGEGGGSGSTYTVRAGDTLESVARAMFGDASLWYMLADANGLSGAAALSAGQVLRIPAGLANLHNTSDTFRPYDSARHIGDTLPTTPKPPKKPKCGGFGAILLAVVAVAVTLIALPGAAPTFLQGVLAGAAGSAASQAVGLATGIQKKFDFKGLALSALAGGVTAGLGDVDIVGKGFSKFMSADKFFNAAIRGLAANALTQGVGVASGLQQRFDWAGVAAAGAGAGVAQGVGGGGRFASSLAGGLAASAAQSLLTGNDFGDTLMGNLPGIIGNTIGNLVAGEISLREEARAGARSFVEKAAELRGLTPGTPEYASFIAQNRETVRSLSHDIAKVQRSGDGGALISVRDQYAEQLLGESFYQGQALLAPLDDQIVVYSQKPEAAIHSLIDPIDMEAGNLAIRASTMANQAIDSIPGGRFAVGLLDLGLTIAGGPGRAALGAVVGKASEEAAGRLTNRFSDVGYVDRDAQAGGVGGPFLLTIATKGVGSALAMGGIFGGIRSTIDRSAFRTERESFWKNEAATNPAAYGPDDLARMNRGKAPIGPDGHPMELHHVDRTPDGGLTPMSRTNHRLGENYKKNHP